MRITSGSSIWFLWASSAPSSAPSPPLFYPSLVWISADHPVTDHLLCLVHGNPPHPNQKKCWISSQNWWSVPLSTLTFFFFTFLAVIGLLQKPFLLASLCAAARGMFIIPPNSMPQVVPPRLHSDWSLVVWHPHVLILPSFVQGSQERRSPDFYRFIHVALRMLISSFFICGIPIETMSSMRTVLSMLVFLTIILLLLNMSCK